MKKNIISLLILFSVLLSLISCEKKYEPVKSTDEENRIVMTAEIDGESYKIKYELYRALFLSLKSEIDGGDDSVWSGENKDEYIARADKLVRGRISEIYSVLHVAKKIGIDVYSKEFDKYVEDFIKVSVEGGYYNDTEITGFEGDYAKYLEYLKKNNLNYSVQDLIIRYSLAGTRIFEYYIGNLEDEEYLENINTGKLKYTKEDVLAFYESDECVRVIKANLPAVNFTRERTEAIRSTLIEKAELGEEAVAIYIIGLTVTGGSDIKAGEIIAPHNLDAVYYSELVSEAFALKTFEVSRVIEISDGYEKNYNIIYKAIKSSAHFEENYEMIRAAYLQNEVGEIIDTAALSFENSLADTDVMNSIIHSEINMD